MIAEAPIKILDIKVLGPDNRPLSHYATGVNMKFIITVKNTSPLRTKVYYSYYFGYMNGVEFVHYKDSNNNYIRGEYIDNVIWVDPDQEREIYFYWTVVAGLDFMGTYCFKFLTVADRFILNITDYAIWEDVKISPVFSAGYTSEEEEDIDKSKQYFIIAYGFLLDGANIACKVSNRLSRWRTDDYYPITGTVPYGSDITAVTPVFYVIDDKATVTVGGVLQESGVTAIDLSSQKIYKVTAEISSYYREYKVDIVFAPEIKGETERPNLSIYTPNGVFQDPIILGKTVNLYCSVSNSAGVLPGDFDPEEPLNPAYDYVPTDESYAEILVYYQDPVTAAWVLFPDANMKIDKTVPQRSNYIIPDTDPPEVEGVLNYVTITKSWVVPFTLPYGTTYGIKKMKMVLPQKPTNELVFDVNFAREVNMIKTISFSEKLGLFQGERPDYSTILYLNHGNDLYASKLSNIIYEGSFVEELKYHLNDVNLEYGFYSEGSSVAKWSVSFYVNNPISEVIFQSLGIEGGTLDGQSLSIDSIEYANMRYHVRQDPFNPQEYYPVTGISYEWENPWQPSWQKDKWYLSIKNAVDTTKVIQSQKLKGMWLRIKINGTGGERAYLRTVFTKIANLFN